MHPYIPLLGSTSRYPLKFKAPRAWARCTVAEADTEHVFPS